MKKLIITIDTEGDNLWSKRKEDAVETENSLFIPRFQELCEKYGFKPVYLTNYEMISDDRYVNYIKPKALAGLCEVGIHIHAWNNPPYYPLEGPYSGLPYLIEYPFDVMKEKFAVTYNLIKEKIGMPPLSHRSGRWAMNDDYFKLLEEFDVKVDCSYTPGIFWNTDPGVTVPCGSDYTTSPQSSFMVGNVLEVPTTNRRTRMSVEGTLKHRVEVFLRGKMVWLRPASVSLKEMINLINRVNKEPNTDYLELMLHSSELMPGGSPYFKDMASIEELYHTLECLFSQVKELKYQGCRLCDYKR